MYVNTEQKQSCLSWEGSGYKNAVIGPPPEIFLLLRAWWINTNTIFIQTLSWCKINLTYKSWNIQVQAPQLENGLRKLPHTPTNRAIWSAFYSNSNKTGPFNKILLDYNYISILNNHWQINKTLNLFRLLSSSPSSEHFYGSNTNFFIGPLKCVRSRFIM